MHWMAELFIAELKQGRDSSRMETINQLLIYTVFSLSIYCTPTSPSKTQACHNMNQPWSEHTHAPQNYDKAREDKIAQTNLLEVSQSRWRQPK